jgi:hypothetical protein
LDGLCRSGVGSRGGNGMISTRIAGIKPAVEFGVVLISVPSRFVDHIAHKFVDGVLICVVDMHLVRLLGSSTILAALRVLRFQFPQHPHHVRVRCHLRRSLPLLVLNLLYQPNISIGGEPLHEFVHAVEGDDVQGGVAVDVLGGEIGSTLYKQSNGVEVTSTGGDVQGGFELFGAYLEVGCGVKKHRSDRAAALIDRKV